MVLFVLNDMIVDDLNLPLEIENGINDSNEVNLIGQKLISPCLKKAKLYRRGTGTFFSSALLYWADSIERLVQDRDN